MQPNTFFSTEVLYCIVFIVLHCVVSCSPTQFYYVTAQITSVRVCCCCLEVGGRGGGVVVVIVHLFCVCLIWGGGGAGCLFLFVSGFVCFGVWALFVCVSYSLLTEQRTISRAQV